MIILDGYVSNSLDQKVSFIGPSQGGFWIRKTLVSGSAGFVVRVSCGGDSSTRLLSRGFMGEVLSSKEYFIRGSYWFNFCFLIGFAKAISAGRR